LPVDVSPAHPGAQVATLCLRTFAGLATFEAGRQKLISRPDLVSEVVRACAFEHASSAVDAATMAVAQAAASPELQVLLLKAGVIPHMIPLMLRFDVTHDESEGSVSMEEMPQFGNAMDSQRGAELLRLGSERSNVSAARNHQAVQASRALARVAGLLSGAAATPKCEPAVSTLKALLTDTLVMRLNGEDPRPLLRELNQSLETPHVIWNNAMRAQLLGLMREQREAVQPIVTLTAETDLSQGAALPADFCYDSLRGELFIAQVFVRVYNEQPNYKLAEPVAFAKGLLNYMVGALREIEAASVAEAPDAARVDAKKRHLLSCLQALQNLLESAPRIAALMAGKPQLSPLLACLRQLARVDCGVSGAAPPLDNVSRPLGSQSFEPRCAALALAVLLKLTQDGGCVEAMSEEQLMLLSFWLVHQGANDAVVMLALRLLASLSGSGPAVWAAACQGGALYLLAVILPVRQAGETLSDAREAVRLAAASLISRLASHSLHGTRVLLLMGRLLPPGLVAALQDGPPDAAISALSQWSETPERVWNAGMARRTADELASLASTARAAQARGEKNWALPESYTIQHEELQDELYVGGVYARLFLKDPRFPLRNPKRFLEGLLEMYPREIAAGASDTAVLLSAAAVALLRVHSLLAEHAVALGYVSKLLELLRGRALGNDPSSSGTTYQHVLPFQALSPQPHAVAFACPNVLTAIV
jgi:DnaJ family protein C protein 13